MRFDRERCKYLQQESLRNSRPCSDGNANLKTSLFNEIEKREPAQRDLRRIAAKIRASPKIDITDGPVEKSRK
jgi:hypothetical protein